MHRESARPAVGFWRGMPTPSLPPKRALAPPPRLRAKHASFCALCAGRPGPASAGTAGQKYGFKNCANLCIFLQLNADRLFEQIALNRCAFYAKSLFRYFFSILDLMPKIISISFFSLGECSKRHSSSIPNKFSSIKSITFLSPVSFIAI